MHSQAAQEHTSPGLSHFCYMADKMFTNGLDCESIGKLTNTSQLKIKSHDK